jgi:hypothetical protein
MASTRNINTRGDYNLEQSYYSLGRDYTKYQHASTGKAYTESFPIFGVIQGHMSRESFTTNSVDVESMLFGINSTNLVNPQKAVKPDFKTIPTSKFYNRLAVPMPKPLVIEKNQRPYLNPI